MVREREVVEGPSRRERMVSFRVEEEEEGVRGVEEVGRREMNERDG